jgi:hypothetical protein
MTIPLSPEVLAAAYSYLDTTPPYKKWNLPHAEDIIFRVGRRPKEAGRYQWDGTHHVITASVHGVGHTDSVMRFMAHEKIHLYLEIMGWESKSHSAEVHNAAFRKFAAQACKHHGWDLKAFY